MGVSCYSGVVLGVKLSEIGFNVETLSDRFEIHDKRGVPTGKFETEHSTKINYKGQETIKKGRLYLEYIEDLIDVKPPLVFFNINYEDFDIDNVVIGVELVKRGYDDWTMLREININMDSVKNLFLVQLGLNIEPKLYYYFRSS